MGIFLVLCMLIGGMCLTPARDNFLQKNNLQNLTRQIGLLGIFSVGECIVIITAGIDLSVGSLIGLAGMVVSILLVTSHWPLWAAFAATIGIGVGVGLIHAFFISGFNIPPFIITLGTLDILRSVARLSTGSMPVPLEQTATAALIITLGNSNRLGLPIPFIILIVIAIAAEIFMRKMPMGRHIYALGGNEEATRLSGISKAKVIMITYVISGCLAALAGIINAGYINEGDPGTGTSFELNAIAAAVIGGCSLFGGEGSVIGTIIGAALLEVLLNAITFLIGQNSSLWQGLIVGCVVVGAVLFNELRDRAKVGGLRAILRRFW